MNSQKTNAICNKKERNGLRKLFLEYVRYLPLIQSIMFTISTCLACSGKYIRFIDFIFALSYNSIFLYYIVGLYQNWCWKYKLGLYYLTISLTLSLTDYFFHIPITNEQYRTMTLIIFGLFVLFYFAKVSYHKRCSYKA